MLRMSTSIRWKAALAALIFVLALVRQAPIIALPWDLSLASTNATFYMGRIVRIWRENGFAALRGEPHLTWVRSDPVLKERYVHHPPLYPWTLHTAVAACGFTEAGMRAWPAVCAALAAALMFLVAARFASPWIAGAATIMVSATPMSVVYGSMPNPESAVLAAVLLTLLLHLRWRERGFRAAPAAGARASYAPVVLAYFLATQLDWQGFFIGPVIVACDLWIGPRRGWFARALALGSAAILSLALTLSVFAWWWGSLGAALHDVFTTASDTTAKTVESMGRTPALWWMNQGAYWTRLYTWPLTIAALAGLPWIAWRALGRADAGARWTLGLLSLAVLNVALFRRHAFETEFWWYFAQPALTMEIALILAVLRARRLLNAVALALLVAAFAGWCAYATSRHMERWRIPGVREIATQLDAQLGPDALIAVPEAAGPECFYLRATIADRIGTPEALRRVAELRRARRLPYRTVVFLINAAQLARHPDLAAILPEIGRPVRIVDQTYVVLEKP
jgi:4-amino-4-deoxy-L-arabinose transferase-like glycosyltransferase